MFLSQSVRSPKGVGARKLHHGAAGATVRRNDPRKFHLVTLNHQNRVGNSA
jgi:hypothetical protein